MALQSRDARCAGRGCGRQSPIRAIQPSRSPMSAPLSRGVRREVLMSDPLANIRRTSAEHPDRWAHQPIAVAAIEVGLGDGGRATVESACGSGTSRIAARATGCLAPAGRVLVTVSILELVAQMVATFATHSVVPLGREIAVKRVCPQTSESRNPKRARLVLILDQILRSATKPPHPAGMS